MLDRELPRVLITIFPFSPYIIDVDENLFGGNMELTIQNLQYIGLLFTLPRVICLLVLFFGAFMAMIFKCQMQISCDSLAPQKIVDAYGKIALFSLIYVVGAQLALFNILSTFGIPFYHIYVEFGQGFVYDVVADSILIATYIGKKHAFKKRYDQFAQQNFREIRIKIIFYFYRNE